MYKQRIFDQWQNLKINFRTIENREEASICKDKEACVGHFSPIMIEFINYFEANKKHLHYASRRWEVLLIEGTFIETEREMSVERCCFFSNKWSLWSVFVTYRRARWVLIDHQMGFFPINSEMKIGRLWSDHIWASSILIIFIVIIWSHLIRIKNYASSIRAH